MKTIHSLSGGKTSSYMAYHYPADYNLFALVKIDDPSCKPKDDKLIQMVSDKIGEDFVATAESDDTLRVMFELEQMIGREIIWVHGKSFDNLIKSQTILPNSLRRFCTQEMKLRPIWDWWFKNINEKVKMGIGFRYDEMERADRFTTSFKGIVGKRGTRNKWEEIEWREGWFPLIDDRIHHFQVKQWALKTGLPFPEDSNCVGCFHKPLQQLRKNFEDYPEKMEWFNNQEKNARGSWKQDVTYEKISKMGLQMDFFFGTGSGCQAGFCTD